MRVELSSKAEKQFDKLNEPDLSKIAAALIKLGKEPPEGDIKKLKNRDGYRLRTGDYRIIYDVDNNRIDVLTIDTRGQAYKKKAQQKKR